ncbi:MAG: PASTA domain-containing protein, partial [Deltaproteobacteria bacterium]|nr:PASTA domain-containing protein [Deltaproteobacteria bacterium]
MKRIIVATLIGICLFTSHLWAQDQAPNDPLAEAMKGAVGLSVGDLSPKYGDTDPAAGGAGGRSAGDRSGAATGSTPASPQNRDPSSPEMSNLIKTWLILAEPPQNATKGANLRYSLRGNMVGRVPGGIITSKHEAGGFDPVYLWTNKRKLDSINHCTMEEFVKARLEGRSISKCMGRYKPPQTSPLDNFKGLKVWDAKVALKKKGLVPVVTQKGPAPEMKLQDAVLSQYPAPGVRLKKGKRVKLAVYGKYVPLIKIPKVAEKSEARAKEKLESLGL